MTTGRPIKEQLSTARYILAQFIAQIEEFENMNREQRRTERGQDLTARIDGLRTGRTTWEQRITNLQHEHDQETP